MTVRQAADDGKSTGKSTRRLPGDFHARCTDPIGPAATTLPRGAEVRNLVLKAMRVALKAGRITRRQYRNARKIRFPDGIPHILGESLKTNKSIKLGYLTAIVYLAPERESLVYGGINACVFASPG